MRRLLAAGNEDSVEQTGWPGAFDEATGNELQIYGDPRRSRKGAYAGHGREIKWETPSDVETD
jgi:hypothetical protein